MQGRYLCVARFLANPRGLVLCSYFPKHCVYEMEIIYLFQYSTSTPPTPKNSKGLGERKSLCLKSIFDWVLAVHCKEIIDDLTLIKAEININKAHVVNDQKK